MSESCTHENTINVGDMPMADPETLEFLGRFDVVVCGSCLEVLSKKPTTYVDENPIPTQR